MPELQIVLFVTKVHFPLEDRRHVSSVLLEPIAIGWGRKVVIYAIPERSVYLDQQDVCLVLLVRIRLGEARLVTLWTRSLQTLILR